MTKTLSEQLCELCGIKPKIKQRECKECPAVMEECGCFDCDIEVHLDFEKPENFVKLLELIATIEDFDIHFSMALNPITSSYTQSVIINDSCGYVGCSNKLFKQGFLEALYKFLEDEEDEDTREYIRNADWDWN